ncbi:MAG: hypothetical protein PHS60_15025 [Zavarzinia sp.]|nr:hypothetical protein [Zavarzinia sp.]
MATYTLVFRRYAPFATFGGGFEGDVRTGPSTDPKASARTAAKVDFGPGQVGPTIVGSSSGSAFGSGPKKYAKIETKLTIRVNSAREVDFTAYSAGSNPLVPGAPDIDTFVDLQVRFMPTMISLSGKVRGDAFPNAEVVVYDPAGTAALLFDFRTQGSRNAGPFTMLMGAGATNTIGTIDHISIPTDASGNLRLPVTCGTTYG